MMRRAWLDIELLEDCIFSARSATEGAHASLDRIPGAALLGAAAARLYGKSGVDALAAFHSGQLRFGDGLPLAPSGAIAWPVPLAWHHQKNARFHNEGRFPLADQPLYNLVQYEPAADEQGRRIWQPKQLRQGYVSVYGEWVRPHRDLRLKTAIDAATGRAAQGQLFGYDALRRGQRFRALVEADEAIDQELFRRVIEALQGEVLLGRSRSAEYGRARVDEVQDSGDTFPPQAGEPDKNGLLTLWLLSDLALTNEQGQPTLQPAPGHFGLEGGKVLWEKTFLRSRRYSPWNAARGGFDRERLVLAAGGVLCIQPPQGYDRKALIERLARGIGRYREAGLGRLWLDPPLLAATHPGFERPSDNTPRAAARYAKEPPRHPLIDWLQDQAGEWKVEADQWAERFVREYLETIERARRLAGVHPNAVFGPSRSQWGQVLAKARVCKGDALRAALFEGEDAVIKHNGEGWNIEVRAGDRYQKLAEWLQHRLDPEEYPGYDEDRARAYTRFVRLSARHIQDHIHRRRT